MKHFTTLFLIMCFYFSYSQEWKTYPYHQDDTHIYFPSDEGVHTDEPTEWWYLVGHIYGTKSGDYYTIMLTYFYYPYQGLDGFRIFNLTNETTNTFHPQVLPVFYDTIADDSLYIICNPVGAPRETWKNLVDNNGKMLPFQYEVHASQDEGAIEMTIDTYKKPLIVGDSGLFYQGGGDNYTYYYSQTGINLSGTITFEDNTESFTGIGWIDRQYGLFNPYSNEAYEWFSVQLSNGVDLNIWNIFTPDHQIPDTSTFVLCSMYIDDDTDSSFHDFTLQRLEYAYMPDSVNCYSQKWNFKYNDIDLIFYTHNPYREVDIPFRFYEGSIEVTGSYKGNEVNGVGFAELLHSYEKPELDFVNPDTTSKWIGEEERVEWMVLNPDDGNPLYYTLAYSSDEGSTFDSLITGTTETGYNWDFSNLDDSTVCIFRLTGASIDGTLKTTIDSDKVTIIKTNAVDETITDNNVCIVFPNPTSGQVFIKSKEVISVQLYSSDGRYIRDLWRTDYSNISNVETNISDELNGVYLLKIETTRGTMTQKIILKKAN